MTAFLLGGAAAAAPPAVRALAYYGGFRWKERSSSRCTSNISSPIADSLLSRYSKTLAAPEAGSVLRAAARFLGFPSISKTGVLMRSFLNTRFAFLSAGRPVSFSFFREAKSSATRLRFSFYLLSSCSCFSAFFNSSSFLRRMFSFTS